MVSSSLVCGARAWPSARACHKMEYLPESNQIFLFGGINDFESDVFLNDTWVYDLTDSEWKQLQTEISPSPRFNHALVYDPTLESVVLFGGVSPGTFVRLSDTWIFNLQSLEWTLIEENGPMGERTDMTLIHDSVTEKIIFFGGGDNDESKHNDMWYFDYSNHTWYEIFHENKPSARYGHDMVYCDSQNTSILFGGRQPSGTTNDFYQFDTVLKNWSIKDCDSLPGVRYWHAMDYSLEMDQILIFGGRDSEYVGANVLGDTWEYDITENIWNQIDADNNPPARVSTDLVCSDNNGCYYLFGGTESISDFQGMMDLWEFDCDSNNWSEIQNSRSISSYPLHFILGIAIFIFVSSLVINKKHLKKK